MRSLNGPAGIVLGIVAAAVIMVGLWFGYTNRQVVALDLTQGKVASAQAETQRYKDFMQQINATGTDELGDKFTRNQLLDRLLPASDMTTLDGQVASSLPGEVASAGLALDSFDSSSGSRAGEYGEYSVVVSGSYSAIVSWTNSLQTRQQLVTITDAKITPRGTGSSSTDGYTAKLTVRYWLDKEPVLEPAVSIDPGALSSPATDPAASGSTAGLPATGTTP